MFDIVKSRIKQIIKGRSQEEGHNVQKNQQLFLNLAVIMPPFSGATGTLFLTSVDSGF